MNRKALSIQKSEKGVKKNQLIMKNETPVIHLQNMHF